MSLRKWFLCGGLLSLALGLVGPLAADPPATARADDKPEAKAADKPRVEVVFVLDTTGSMSGLIDAAKKKIGRSATRSPAANRRRKFESAWSIIAIGATPSSPRFLT